MWETYAKDAPAKKVPAVYFSFEETCLGWIARGGLAIKRGVDFIMITLGDVFMSNRTIREILSFHIFYHRFF